MSDPLIRECLSQLLINVARSLLQYCGESWPWTDPLAQSHYPEVQQMVEAQQEDVAALIELMQNREIPINMGTYPDNSGLHYVSLEYFLHLLENNQAEVVSQVDNAVTICQPDAEASELLKRIQTREADYLKTIQELRTKTKPQTSAS